MNTNTKGRGDVEVMHIYVSVDGREISWMDFCLRYPELAQEFYEAMGPHRLQVLMTTPGKTAEAKPSVVKMPTRRRGKGSLHEYVLQLISQEGGASMNDLIKATKSDKKRIWNMIYFLRSKKGISIMQREGRYQLQF